MSERLPGSRSRTRQTTIADAGRPTGQIGHDPNCPICDGRLGSTYVPGHVAEPRPPYWRRKAQIPLWLYHLLVLNGIIWVATLILGFVGALA